MCSLRSRIRSYKCKGGVRPFVTKGVTGEDSLTCLVFRLSALFLMSAHRSSPATHHLHKVRRHLPGWSPVTRSPVPRKTLYPFGGAWGSPCWAGTIAEVRFQPRAGRHAGSKVRQAQDGQRADVGPCLRNAPTGLMWGWHLLLAASCR